MNFSRALTLLRSASSKQRLLRAPVASVHSHLFSTKASQNKRSVQKKVKPSPEQDELKADPIMNLKRPTEIPFQTRVANTVNLIGTVGVPVQKETLSDGRVTAVSVLIQEYPDLPKVWIPIIFQGELAEVAAAYLKENETVYITGQLNGDTEPVKVNENQANVQVLAQTLQYVVDPGSTTLINAITELDVPTIKEKEDSVSYTEADIAGDLSSLQLWSDLLNNPNDWYDNRADKRGKNTPDFRHKRTKQQLWINKSTPSWVILKLEEPPFSLKNPIGSPKQGEIKKPNSSYVELWDDVVANPQNWVDKRMDKQKGLVKFNYPDFKHKVTKDALWINTAPILILKQLDQLKIDSYSARQGKPFSSNGAQTFSNSPSVNRSQTYIKKNGETATGAVSKDALWKDLVDNPQKWQDNRSNKVKPNHPDFKHKDTGEALWIGKTTPRWVLENLPSENATLLS
ncbi:protein OSB3, chloroplastic/mitochondrial-like isoform X2 [Carex rostrata]